jgi:hypothetical protein
VLCGRFVVEHLDHADGPRVGRDLGEESPRGSDHDGIGCGNGGQTVTGNGSLTYQSADHARHGHHRGRDTEPDGRPSQHLLQVGRQGDQPGIDGHAGHEDEQVAGDQGTRTEHPQRHQGRGQATL